jgi:hypothetical protein
MSRVCYTYQRGETIQIALDAVEGDPTLITAITAKMRALRPGKRTIDLGAPDAATFAVSERAAVDDQPGGWTMTIDATTSAGLAVGSYLADAKLVVAAGTFITEPLEIQITEPATS